MPEGESEMLDGSWPGWKRRLIFLLQGRFISTQLPALLLKFCIIFADPPRHGMDGKGILSGISDEDD